jgi:hypothetical protein
MISIGLALVITTSVIAYAFWTGIGTGTGEAKTGGGNQQGLTVHQTTIVDGLTPGGAPVTISGNFDNPNANPVHVNNVTASLGAVPAGPDGTKPPCTAADFDLSPSAAVNADIPNGNGVGSWTGITIKLKETGLNQDNCKSATRPITYGGN